MRRVAKRVIVVAAVSVCSACSFITSIDGLSDGDAGLLEAGSADALASDVAMTDSAITPDGQVDGATTDGSFDASTDSSATDAFSSDVTSDVATADAKDAGAVDAKDGAVASAYRAAVIADGPVAYFRFEDSATVACVNEIVGSAYSCTYTAASTTRGVAGIAGSLGVRLATNQGVVSLSAPSFDFSKPHSIEFWVKVDAAPVGNLIASCEESAPLRTGLTAFLFTSSAFRTELWNGDQFQTYTLAASPLTAQAWHHIVMGHDNGTYAFAYVDGVKSGGGNPYIDASGPVVSIPFKFVGWTGTLEELAVYDKPLAANRIAAHYALQ